ncbi:hypothetical protein Q8W71_31990 [Methylobacterium sp. NEAU 140]|uniref:hypothetical protein n=1 Tax=Methylobacterium sp. NEAU 140 TaxID=3064945 RepID=UPI002734D436|nr:hypothetical protein [Methylobacterium sp. NEAU 140]MDP4027197.1 hypothetical protein [Methylobacterium sp. NEAU 140]
MIKDKEHSACLLRKIADALGKPVEALFAVSSDFAAPEGAGTVSPDEVRALLTAFVRLKDGASSPRPKPSCDVRRIADRLMRIAAHPFIFVGAASSSAVRRPYYLPDGRIIAPGPKDRCNQAAVGDL